MKGVTPRQSDILSFIRTFSESNRYAPSFREIQTHFGFKSLGSVHKHIEVLKRKGLLEGQKHAGRSLALVGASHPQAAPTGIELPFIGVISAGYPIEMFAQNRMYSVPESLVHSPDKTYLLQVKGDSLQEELMADGDMLIVEARQVAHPGEMVVGLINQHDTIIKRFYPEGAYIRLVASNPHLRPMLINPEDIQIQAVVIGLLRGY